MHEKNDLALVLRSPNAIEKAEPGAKRILAVIVADMLALAPVEDPESLFRKAADQGNANTQSGLGRMHAHRDGRGSAEAKLVAEKQTFPVASKPWENTLGMKFVPVPGTEVLFSIWDTRVQDYDKFESATGREWSKPNFPQSPTHPAVNVSWEDAQAFCGWLTMKEQAEGRIWPGQKYRLPTDAEWSVAVGLDEPVGGTPQSKSKQIKGVYPWGTQWPPPRGAGNYGDETAKRTTHSDWTIVTGYDDGFADTSPVGSFTANRYGLFDMGGNVWQWCEDFYDGKSGTRVLRGASWDCVVAGLLLSSYRGLAPVLRDGVIGFRCVVAVGGASSP